MDRAALEFALRHGLPYGGWCPRGGWAEDQPAAPGVLRLYPRLTETPSADPGQRTAWNVRDSHATLILVRGGAPDRSPGTDWTRQCAELVFLRPCLVADIVPPETVGAVTFWLERTASGLGVAELILNVAGPRESEAPGLGVEAGRFLDAVLAALRGRGF